MATGKALNNTDTFVKNVALSTAFSQQKLTLRKYKALHVLALTVREQFFARHPHYSPENIHTITKQEIENGKSTYEVGEAQVMQSMGYDNKRGYYSLTQVLNIFEELAHEPMYFDGLGIVNRKTQSDTYSGFFRPIGQAERENGVFKFHVPPMMVYYIIHPEVSLNAPISWSGYKTKYSPGIYETCLYYFQNGETTTDYFPIETLRQITDTLNSSTYDKFNNFKERVIEKTLASINDSPELKLHLSYEASSLNQEKRRGRRTITHLRFHIKEKTASLSQKSDVRNSIVLSAMRAEIESLGVPKHSVESVLSECTDGEGVISVPFVKWTVRKAHEIRQMKKFHIKDPKESNKEQNFGGYYRKHIVRARKQEWFAIRELLQTKAYQDSNITSAIQIQETDQIIEMLESKLKRKIAQRFLKNFEDYGFNNFEDGFRKFLETQLPTVFNSYNRGDYGPSLTEMAELGNPYLLFYFDYAFNVFSADAFQAVINEPD